MFPSHYNRPSPISCVEYEVFDPVNGTYYATVQTERHANMLSAKWAMDYVTIWRQVRRVGGEKNF